MMMMKGNLLRSGHFTSRSPVGSNERPVSQPIPKDSQVPTPSHPDNEQCCIDGVGDARTN